MQIFLVWLRANRLRLFDVRHVLCHLCTLCSQLEIGFGFVFRFRFRIQILVKAYYQPVEQFYVAQRTYAQIKYKKNPISFELRAKARQLIIGIYSVFSYFIVNQEDALCRNHLETVCAFAFHCSVIFM